MNLGLKDKAAFVTGSSKGLGFATAKTLATEGARVVISSRDAENLKAAAAQISAGENLSTYACDVTNPKECDDLVHHTINTFGSLDILITNCGGPAPGNFENISNEQWEEAINKSFKSNVFLIRLALPFLKKSLTPSILTITSFTVKQPIDNMILSNSIRAAATALTKSLSFEMGKYGIRVNSILPGWTLTQRVNSLLQNRSATNQTTVEEETARITRDITLGRMGDPQEFANAAVFLVSPAASFVNGVMLNVDDGIYKGVF